MGSSWVAPGDGMSVKGLLAEVEKDMSVSSGWQYTSLHNAHNSLQLLESLVGKDFKTNLRALAPLDGKDVERIGALAGWRATEQVKTGVVEKVEKKERFYVGKPELTGKTLRVDLGHGDGYDTWEVLVDGKSFKWSGPKSIPFVGDKVDIHMNGFGKSIVVGYFTSYEFAGIMAKPVKPPVWWKKQNAGHVKAGDDPHGFSAHGVALFFGNDMVPPTCDFCGAKSVGFLDTGNGTKRVCESHSPRPFVSK